MYCWHYRHYSHVLLLCLTDQPTEWCTFWPISSLAWLLHCVCVCVCLCVCVCDFVPAHVWFEDMIFGTDFLHAICLCIWVFTPQRTHFCQVFVMWMFWLLNTCVRLYPLFKKGLVMGIVIEPILQRSQGKVNGKMTGKWEGNEDFCLC